MSLFSVQIQAVAQLLKSGSPVKSVKSIDLGNTCISDDGAQAYGLMGWARGISDKVLVEVAPFRHIVRCIAMQQLRQRIHTMNLSCNRGSKRMTGRQVRKYQRNPKGVGISLFCLTGMFTTGLV